MSKRIMEGVRTVKEDIQNQPPVYMLIYASTDKCIYISMKMYTQAYGYTVHTKVFN